MSSIALYGDPGILIESKKEDSTFSKSPMKTPCQVRVKILQFNNVWLCS